MVNAPVPFQFFSNPPSFYFTSSSSLFDSQPLCLGRVPVGRACVSRDHPRLTIAFFLSHFPSLSCTFAVECIYRHHQWTFIFLSDLFISGISPPSLLALRFCHRSGNGLAVALHMVCLGVNALRIYSHLLHIHVSCYQLLMWYVRCLYTVEKPQTQLRI